MMKSMLVSGVIAGFAAGLLAALLHFAFVQNLLLLAETYESGTAVHFGGVGALDEAGHDHDAAAAMTADKQSAAEGDHSHAAAAQGDHDHNAGEARTPKTRNTLTVMFAFLIWVAYGLIMVAGFALAENWGHDISLRQGVLWGLAGFLTFQMAPAMGLAPELPGSMTAELELRQVWWWGTALATAGGLGLLGYGKGFPAWIAAVALIALPHIIGAPMPDGFGGVAPPELAGAFAARTLGVGLIAWIALGAIAALQWRSDRPSSVS